ncbi:MAG: 1,4-dihydroxy-6-naphthoate synthase [Chitinophagaceae bacterium]
MKFKLGFSPCPNDTFIFDALVNGKMDTDGLEFEIFMEDVETLNKWSLQEKLDITKISYGVLPKVIPLYRVLNSGGALGKGVGPLLVSKKILTTEDIINSKVALPGMNTTAHMLFTLAFPEVQNKIFMSFSQIEDAVLNGEVDCGVIIHENRFTYADKGLQKIIDLGAYWEENTGNPIPLGGIIMKRTFDHSLMQKIDGLIRKSIELSWKTYPELTHFIKSNAQEMSEDIMRKHIELYVNDYSLSLGTDGRAAIWKMLEIGSAWIPKPAAGTYEIFI